ncbi:MAG: MATE family efflux transporter [Gammaproteobacteria bacterium]|nr:MAG: MATE family efflux transporter [Gammaproteobacteria bacterium]
MQQQTARFTTGSTWRHVVVMTLTNSIGLMALFFVDLLDLYFLNLLGEQELAASVGFASQLLFYVTAMSIGLLIAVGVLVSQRIGAAKTESARRIVASALVIAVCLMLVVSGILLWNLKDLLVLLGAKGRTLDLAVTYAGVLLPSSVILVISMVSSSVLRAVGDARRSMTATLIGAMVNLCFDPLLIFYFDMGVAGAAWASVLSRLAMMSYSLSRVIRVYHMLTKPTLGGIAKDFAPIAKLAGPAMLTNLASPVGSTFVMTAIARYGDAAVAAYATIGRMIPVAFSVLFALSGAISPIIGQNFGAKSYDRVKAVYHNAIAFAVSYVVVVAVLILFGQHYLIGWFSLSGEAAALLTLFCSGLTFFFIADGVLFSTNSVFNSLGYPLYSTFFNYAKFFIGVIPAVYTLSYFYGAKGVIIGQATGPVLISLAAVWMCHQVIRRVSQDEPPADQPRRRGLTRLPLWPTSSSKTQV